jgi:uncharacterized membrane protein (UPF0136 family)
MLLASIEPRAWIGSWRPGIGDPTAIGWLTTFSYVLATGLCLASSRAISRASSRETGVPDDRGEARLWLALTIAMALLGINKQLDLQTLLTEVGRTVARQQGWYQRRHHVQLIFAIIFTAAAVAGAVLLVFLARRQGAGVRVALFGGTLLIGFIVVRMLSFHNIDRLLGQHWGEWTTSALCELGGIACIALGAGASLWKLRRPRGSARISKVVR